MKRRDRQPGFVIPPDAPIVPQEWTPALEEPALRSAASPLAVAAVVLGFVTVIALVVWGGWRWYAIPVVETALAGVEASVSGDLHALEPLLLPATAKSPEFRRALAAVSATSGVRSGPPVWRGTTAEVRLTADGKAGSLTMSPAMDALGQAVVRWSGAPFGNASGRVILTDEGDGWRVLYIQVGKKGVSLAPEDAKSTFGR